MCKDVAVVMCALGNVHVKTVNKVTSKFREVATCFISSFLE